MKKFICTFLFAVVSIFVLSVPAYADDPEITFPNVSEISYPQKISEAILTEGSTNGTFAWENPDEQLPPGTYTRKIIFIPNDSDLYDYPAGELIKEVQLTVNKADPPRISPIILKESGLTGNRKIHLCYQVYSKSGVDTPTGKIKLINRVTGNGGTQTDEVIATLDLVYGKTEEYTWNIANDNNFTIIAQYSGDDYYNSLERSTVLDTRRNTPVITISNIGQKTYGDAAFFISGSALLPDLTDNLPMTYTSSDTSILNIQGNAATIQKAGTVVITAKVNETEEYLSASSQLELIVNKKTITFAADNKEVEFGGTLPEYTYADVQSQLVENDQILTPPLLTCSAKNTNTVGTYPIEISGAVLSNSDCYNVVYLNGTLTVNPEESHGSDGSDSLDTGVLPIVISGPDGQPIKAFLSLNGSSASLNVSAEELEKLPAGANSSGEITIDAAPQKGIITLKVSADAIKALIDNDGRVQKVHFKLDFGTISLDRTALKSVLSAEGTESITFSIKNGAEDIDSHDAKLLKLAAKTSMEVNIMDGDKPISQIDGSIAVSFKADNSLCKAGIYTIDENGNLEYVKTYHNGDVITFYPLHFSPYYAVSIPFTDIPENTWYNNDVAFTYLEGLFTGTSDTTFSPDEPMTRAMLVTVLWRKEGMPQVDYAMSFSDIEDGAYYTEAVRWAASERIVSGYDETHFGANDKITREQLIAILYRYVLYKNYSLSVGEGTNMPDYKDAFEVSEYAIPAMQWACETGLIKGANGNLMPGDSATRAQVAAMLHRFTTYIEK